MNIEAVIWIGVGIAGILFGISYIGTFILAENRKWLIGWGWITLSGAIGLIIAIGLSILLAFTTSFEIMVLVIAGIWGFAIGITCGFTHYKFKHRTNKGYW